jgi:hypothetical protein
MYLRWGVTEPSRPAGDRFGDRRLPSSLRWNASSAFGTLAEWRRCSPVTASTAVDRKSLVEIVVFVHVGPVWELVFVPDEIFADPLGVQTSTVLAVDHPDAILIGHQL